MPAPKEPSFETPGGVWASELRHYRVAAGLTQEELAARISYTPAMVSSVETGRRTPSLAMAEACDEALGTGGALARLREKLLKGLAFPTWFRPWRDVEQEANVLRSYEAMVVPGLLQTEAYARALLNDDEAVQARLDRQTILVREDDDRPPPRLRCLIDEGALHRDVGGPETMIEQLGRLVHVSSPQVIVQIVPTGVHPGLQGSFVLASLEGETVGYLETATRGLVITSKDDLDAAESLFESILAEALPPRPSLDKIRRMSEQWKT